MGRSFGHNSGLFVSIGAEVVHLRELIAICPVGSNQGDTTASPLSFAADVTADPEPK